MQTRLFQKLHEKGYISDNSLRRVEAAGAMELFSLYWEIRFLLYLGVFFLTGGLGVLVYKNIDSIGHQAVLAFIACVTAGSFYYCIKKRNPFSWAKVRAPNNSFDYILLLGCLSLLIFLGYLQYEYGVFGDRYGLATFIPMVILFFTAYFFDHLGVLSMAITNLAAWAGIAITPLSILKNGNFTNVHLITAGLLLGAALLLAGHLSTQKRLKPHFELTYTNFGLNLFFIAALSGLFTFDNIYLLWFIALLATAWYCFRKAMARKSFYFLVLIVLYTYVALSYIVIQLLKRLESPNTDSIGLGLLYFILSAAGAAMLLIRLNRQIKAHDSL